ncbi:DUF1697 domain-containing protein [Alkalihalobacillus oceani]|uniref:DUF1697 domain-containing protein n=1 Tax=Halalkalibacter oceani TaxID=1653776 RepID=UPI00203F2A9C|nr:DUF1697 domain-containing protein [Halalkalibacter oceani]MCM3762894.1 DUF1697 domain-containing protein [Halalkalibacter oceani]
MESYVVYLRGINVGGKNKIKMADLRTSLHENGCENVHTYIQSGNIVLQSELSAQELARQIETIVANNFKLDSSLIKVLALDAKTYRAIIEEAPHGYGEESQATDYRYDVLFLLDVTSDQVMKEVMVRQGIDMAWQGSHAIYYRRPGPGNPDYTKSYLSKLVKKDIYQSITVRNWKTATKMWDALQEL